MFVTLTLSLLLGQSAPASGGPADDPPAAQAAAPGTPRVPGRTPDAPMQLPLMREGTFLTRTTGTIELDASLGAWFFTAEKSEGEDMKRRFGLLPSRALEDMLGIIDERGGDTRFELTARVLIYDGMNFILPSIATPLSEVSIVPAESDSDEPVRSPANSLDSTGDVDVGDQLEARLRERIGILPESSDASSDPDAPPTMREGTRLQNRRGMIIRDQRSGTWRFVFDADGTDVVDPPMEFLPCLLLERLQRKAAVSDLPGTVLISGEVTSFHGRNYLLPTLWRPVGNGRNIVR